MRFLLLITCLSMPQLFAADQARPVKPQPPRYSREQLDRIRESLLSQIAVRDDAENTMRAPTPEEAAALAPSPQTTPSTAISVKGGGRALKADPSQLSFAVAEVGDDGRLMVSHGTGKPAIKGGGNVR
jgi:hypothetical protein